MIRKRLFVALVIILVGTILLFVMRPKPDGKAVGTHPLNLAVGAEVRLPERQEPVVIQSFDFDQPGNTEGWKPLRPKGEDRIWTEEGRLHFRMEGAPRSKIRKMIDLDTTKVNLVELRVPQSVSMVSVSWLTELGQWSRTYLSYQARPEEDRHIISIDVGESTYWRGRIKGLTIAFWITSRVSEIEVDWIHLLGDKNPSFVMRPGRVGYAIAGERQWVVPSEPPGEFQRKVQIPQAARLRFSCGLSWETWQSHSTEVLFQVLLKRGREELQTLASVRLRPKALGGAWEWTRKEISLEDLAGERAEFVFQTSAEDKDSGGLALWGNPTIEPFAVDSADTRPNLMVLLIDAVRPDHLGLYGYERPTSPNLDALAKESIVFDNAFAQSHSTHLSVASLFTSLFPLEAKVKEAGYFDLKQGILTLAEQLEAAGYLNAAFSGTFLIHWDYGFDRGFDTFFSPEGVPAAKPLTDKILQWLEERPRRPFLVYAHYMDAHAPYRPPEESRARFLPADYQPADVALLKGECYLMSDKMAEGHKYSAQDQAYLKGLYDGEIASIDRNIGRIIEFLRNEGIYDNTVIVVLADHGEEFWEHGGLEHARTLHDEILRIPLILKLLPSANQRGERVSATVRQVDLYPTLLELAGVSLSSDIRGESLLHIDPEESRWEYAETPYLAALRGEGWKFIAKSRPKQDELYNLEEDPSERKNVVAEYPERAARMREEMNGLMRTEEFSSGAGQEYKKVDPKTLERLRALGYVK